MPKVLVFGSGGRDQCLAQEYAESPHVQKVYIMTGTPGIEYTAHGKKGHIERVTPKGLNSFKETAEFCRDFCMENGVNLVDVGSENPLDQGLIDVLYAAGIPAIGPPKQYAVIENNREFTAKMLSKIGKERYGNEFAIKPEWRSFTDPEEAKKYVRRIGYQTVVKANGLAAGKGAIVCDDVPDALEAIDTIMVQKKFGDSGNKVVIEERKYGNEISFFAYLDGESAWPLKMFAKDYKPAFDPDDLVGMFEFKYGLEGSPLRRGIQELGLKFDRDIESLPEEEKIKYLDEALRKSKRKPANPNTGGTGCVAPHRLVKPPLVNRIIREMVNPVTNEIYNRLGWKYKGVLYFGLNLDPDGNLQDFEINIRHGDPEWEVIARKLQTDLYEIGMATWEGKLDQLEQRWNDNHYVDVVAMLGRSKDANSGGWFQTYPGRHGPGKNARGYKIEGLDEMERGTALFYAGVDKDERGLVANSGRVLHVVSSSPSLQESVEKAYRNVGKIKILDHNNGDRDIVRFRKSIGKDLLESEKP
jgi:phosphoribosylamine--glycine ligase